MTDDITSLPTTLDTGRCKVSTLDRLASIPEEEIWLQKQKSARTRRAYRLDVQHFMRSLSITTPAELRQACTGSGSGASRGGAAAAAACSFGLLLLGSGG